MRKGLLKFVASVKIGLKDKKEEVQDIITSSYKIFFLLKNQIIYLIQETGLVYHFSSQKYLNFTFA